MIAYYRPKQEEQDDVRTAPPRTSGLSRELFHGLTPEQFDVEAKALAQAQAMTPAVRARLKAQLVERLKTPVDEPSWGPDWVKHGEKVAAHSHSKKKGALSKLIPFGKQELDDEEEEDAPLNARERTDSEIIARNMEKSRQVAHYRPLYIVAAGLALTILLVAMFVDYHIIREVWTRALANEFMVVPPALQSSVVFKSLQVVFAVLIVHFMLKISGVYGRNTMIVASFILALVMIGGLGYLVAYNNMAGATSAQHEQSTIAAPDSGNSIDQLFADDKTTEASLQPAAHVTEASTAGANTSGEGVSLGLPKISQASLANADSWFWLAFASVVFFIVTTVAALYMQTVENNVRNYHIAQDYSHRRRQFAQLHLLELADQPS
ncbi:MAG TPA: hypothetical protein VG889_15825 [Rhizomicrobium sp.]|nr:hypothetical protein [Rhizomicrobium sp.]